MAKLGRICALRWSCTIVNNKHVSSRRVSVPYAITITGQCLIYRVFHKLCPTFNHTIISLILSLSDLFLHQNDTEASKFHMSYSFKDDKPLFLCCLATKVFMKNRLENFSASIYLLASIQISRFVLKILIWE